VYVCVVWTRVDTVFVWDTVLQGTFTKLYIYKACDHVR